MNERNTLSSLPDWKYAGCPAEGILARTTKEDAGPFTIRGYDSNRLDPQTGAFKERFYKVVDGYLIPHLPQTKTEGLEPDNSERASRGLKVLESRVRRFRESTQRGIVSKVHYDFLENEFEVFHRELTSVQAKRAEYGQPPFSLSLNKTSWSEQERELIGKGSSIVGHTVDRLERLGKILLHAERLGLGDGYNREKAEELCAEVRVFGLDDIARDINLLGDPTDDNLARLMARVAIEFRTLHKKITADPHIMLVRCVLTADGRVDHDGIFHHYLREIGKPVQKSMQYWLESRITTLEAQLEEAHKRAAQPENHEESMQKAQDLTNRLNKIRLNLAGWQRQFEMAMDNIVTDMGACLGAIDETHAIMLRITDHPLFRNFTRLHSHRIERGDEALPFVGFALNKYDEVLREFVTLSRARACIPSDDYENYSPLVNRWRFISKELDAYHKAMGEFANDRLGKPIPTAMNSVELLKRGKNMIEEMADLRMPRNRKATMIYDEGIAPTDLPDDSRLLPSERLTEKEKTDMSTVGRFRRKVWLLEHDQLKNQGIEL